MVQIRYGRGRDLWEEEMKFSLGPLHPGPLGTESGWVTGKPPNLSLQIHTGDGQFHLSLLSSMREFYTNRLPNLNSLLILTVHFPSFLPFSLFGPRLCNAQPT